MLKKLNVNVLIVILGIAVAIVFTAFRNPQLFEKDQAVATVPTATTSQQVWDYVGTLSPGESITLSNVNSVNVSAFDHGGGAGHVVGCKASVYSRDTYTPTFIQPWLGEQTFDYNAGTVKLICLGTDGRVEAYVIEH